MKLWFALRSMTLLLAVCSTALASTIWYVDGVNGSDSNDCKSAQHPCKTIGHAISLASSGESIMVAAATYQENLTIRVSLKIVGSGARTTVIDGGAVNTVVTISNTEADVVLSKMTIQDGLAPLGGGIYNVGTLRIDESTISGNMVRGKYLVTGGGIWSIGTLTINNSTLSGNQAISDNSSGTGGGITNLGTLTISNSTLSGNQAHMGGGIENSGTLTISNSTLSGNGTGVGDGIASDGGAATLQNSIVANGLGGGNCYGTMTSNGYNLSSDETCRFNHTGDLNNTKPKLELLQNNGGPTQTMALLQGSPAIDTGNPTGCTDGQGHLLKTDQRGKPRPEKKGHGRGCDMGAFERQKD